MRKDGCGGCKLDTIVLWTCRLRARSSAENEAYVNRKLCYNIWEAGYTDDGLGKKDSNLLRRLREDPIFSQTPTLLSDLSRDST